MPRRKDAPSTPNYPWLNGELSIGEIILKMAQELLIEKQNQPNQLAAQLEVHLDSKTLEAEFVRRVNAAFAVELREAERLVTSGEKGGQWAKAKAQEKDNEFMPNVKKCIDSLKAEGTRITTKTIASKWKGLEIKGSPPSDRKLSQLKKMILSLP